MATNSSQSIDALRPDYDFSLPSLTDSSNSRGYVYQLISSGSRVLDVGCDTGRFGEALRRKKGCIVDGIEPSLFAAEAAHHRLNQVFIQSIENEQSFNELLGYDVILFLDVLEHLENPWSVLKGAYKALQPKGIIYVVVPNVAHISVIRRLLKGQFEYSDHGTMDRTHLRWFTRSSLRRSLDKAGFENIEVDVIPQVPYLSNLSLFSKLVVNQLTKIFPDQLGGSIIGQGQKPNSNMEEI